MNVLFELHYPHTTQGPIAQPLRNVSLSPNPTFQQLAQLLDGQWPLQDLNFHVRLDHAATLWQNYFIKEVQQLAEGRVEKWTEANYHPITQLLQLWLKVVKKMEFYRLEADFQRILFHPLGFYSLYDCGNLRSIYLLSEIQKYRVFEEGTTLQELKQEEQASIFKDVSLKIARHVLLELKAEMYLPGKDLMFRLLKLYGFKYDHKTSFFQNYQKAIKDKQVINLHGREASIVLFTLKISHSLQTLEGLCDYLNYLKCVLLDRTSGVLSADYDLWTILYETCLKIYSRHQNCFQHSLLEIDQIMTSPLTDQEFQMFIIKNIAEEKVNLSSVNFYIKNCRKEQRDELKPYVLKKIEGLLERTFWASVEDIYEYLQNELEGEEKKENMKRILKKMLLLPYQEITVQQLYDIQYGVSFLIENCMKYFENDVEILGESIVSQMLKITRACRAEKKTKPSLIVCFRVFNMFMGTVYLEIDHEDWKVNNLEDIIELVSQFSSLGFVCSKAALKLLYHFLSQSDGADNWEQYFGILAEHYFIGGYDENSDLEIIHSHEQHKQMIATKILQKFSQLAACQLTESRQFHSFLQEEKDMKIKESWFAVRGQRDNRLLEGIQNICLTFNSHLSMQTLEFSLNFASPFGELASWQVEEEEPSLLSLICEEMPIEVLKFVYKELSAGETINCKVLQKFPSTFWARFWSNRASVAKSLSSCRLEMEQIEELQKLRRLQLVMDLANCVFDKLNEHSQKNIKEIKLIYQGGVHLASKVLSKLNNCFLEGSALSLFQKSQKLSYDQVKGLSLCGDNGSLLEECYISTNSMLATANLFNQIGRVNESSLLINFKKVLMPCFPHLSCNGKDHKQEAIIKQFQIISSIESTWNEHLTDNDNVFTSKEWNKQMTVLLDELKHLISKETDEQKDGCEALKERLNQHIRGLLGKLVLPAILTQLLLKEGRTSTKILYGLMRSSMEIINIMNNQYEEHLITLVQRLEDNLKESGKGWTVQPTQILCLLELMFDLIFSGVRIRSYHLYRVIKYYQKASSEPAALFNTIIASYIRLCFEEFITNYKPPTQLVQLSCNKKNLTASHQKLSRQEIKLGTVEAACMLSMFINLFCRLNYSSLGAGVDKIFGDEEGKVIYMDYLISLSRRISQEETSIATRELEILKIDVYGNLSIITKNTFSERLLNKLISLAKHLLRVKVDMKGINKLPVKLLAQKLAVEPLSLSLQEFEDEWKAISLGALSVYRRISKNVSSNIHLVNLHFISGKSLIQNVDLNSKLIIQTKKLLQEEMREIGKNGIQALHIQINPCVSAVIDGLIGKIELYHDLCSKEKEYIEKLYASFKILCITCLNLPEIIPLVLSKRLNVQGKSTSFTDFLLQTLKICLPLFCQFSAMMAKSNCGFQELAPEDFVPLNFIFDLQVKTKLIVLLSKEIANKTSEFVFLAKAVTFLQNHNENNRFKAYRFAKLHNDTFERLLKESDRKFNLDLIKVCEAYIGQEESTSFSCRNIFQILEVALEKCNTNPASLDLKKLYTEQEISKIFMPERTTSYKGGESDRKSREVQTARPRQQSETSKYHILLSNAFEAAQKQINQVKTTPEPLKSLLKGNFCTILQEEIISVSESKVLELEWSSDGSMSEINNNMVQKFRIFNQEIQSKEFMKDLAAFPSKNGIDLIDKSILMAQGDCIAESDIIEENFYTESNLSSDAIIESYPEQIPQPSQEEFIKFSIKAIEEGQELQLPSVPSLKNSDSIVYSELQIGRGEDGSMKLCGEDLQSYRDLYHSQREEITKDNIMELIEDFTLNPEAIKQIVLKIKFLPIAELFKVYSQQSGEIAFVLEAELRSRGVSVPCKEPISSYQHFFIDEGKLFEKVRGGRYSDEKELVVPEVSPRFVKEWIMLVLRSVGESRPLQPKRISSFIRKIALNKSNILHLLVESLKIISTNNDSFQTEFSLPYSKLKKPEWFKQVLIDSLFGAFVEQRAALSAIFHGWWSPSLKCLTPLSGKEEDSIRVIQLILEVLLTTPQKTSTFLKILLDYISCLNKTSKFVFPYLEIQDSISVQSSLSQKMSNQLRLNEESFSDNPKLLMLFNVMSYLQLKTLKEFLQAELTKTAEVISRVCEKEDQVLQHFQRLYGHEEGVQLQRKAQIYWKLRKGKNLEDRNGQLALSRRILTDLTVRMLDTIKENCFALYYRREEREMKEQLAYIHRKFSEARNYSEKYALEQEFRQKEKKYVLWRRNLLNLIVVEDISPAIDDVSGPFLTELRKSTGLMTELHTVFGEIGDRTPILFGVCSQLYKLMLAFDIAKKEHEATFHSMSNLKTLPSINSTREASAVRRRSSLVNHRSSAFNMISFDIGSVLKKCALLLPAEALGFTPNDPLMGGHAKNADTETKLRYLKTENRLGEKIIEITRESVWADTYPHLDQNFGQHDIKINIKGQMGLDYGGVTREWVNMLIKQITDPKLGLFQLNVNELAFQPSKTSYLVPNHLQIFNRLGILVGKALKEGWLLEINFTKSFLKHMLGATLYVEDLEDIDPHTARGLMWILKNYIGEELGLNFTYEEEVLEQKITIELVPGGAEVAVTEANKKQYVKKLAYTKMTENIREQSLAFMSGVEKVIPTTMLRLLNYREIGKFLSGCAVIDIDEMQKHAKYEGWSDEDQNVKWFWSALRSKSEQDKAEFLFFLTGSYRVPYSGFKQNPVTVNKMGGCKDYLPVAHTCFSIIDLPEYSSSASLDKMLTCAVKEGKGFTVS